MVAASVGAGAGGYFAPHVRAYINRSGAPNNIGAIVAVKDRRNGAKNPLAHLHQPDITVEKVMESPMLWDPIRYDETCPSSDGAAAMVIGDEAAADARVADGHPVAWINATALRTEPLAYAGRDQVNPQASPLAILTRLVGRDDPATTSFFWTGMSGAVAITLVGIWHWEPIAGRDIPWLLLLCLGAACAHFMLIKAYELAEASSLQPFSYTQLVWVSLFGVTIFGETLAPNVALGGAIVVGAGLFTWWRSRQRARAGLE